MAAPKTFTFVGSPRTWRQRLSVALASAPDAAVSHRAASRWHSLDGFDTELVEITVVRGRRPRIPGAIVHQVSTPLPEGDPADPADTGDIIVLDGIRVTTIARTIVDVAALVDARTLERAGDGLERRGHPLDRLEEVAVRLHRPGQKGTKALLRHIAERRRGGRVRGSWFEKLIEECIASPRLPAVERQYVIEDRDGLFPARVDLAFPTVRLGIEAHSRGFHTGERTEVVEQRRDNLVALAGWDLRYLGWADRKTPAQARRFLARLPLAAADVGDTLEWTRDRQRR